MPLFLIASIINLTSLVSENNNSFVFSGILSLQPAFSAASLIMSAAIPFYESSVPLNSKRGQLGAPIFITSWLLIYSTFDLAKSIFE